MSDVPLIIATVGIVISLLGVTFMTIAYGIYLLRS